MTWPAWNIKSSDSGSSVPIWWAVQVIVHSLGNTHTATTRIRILLTAAIYSIGKLGLSLVGCLDLLARHSPPLLARIAQEIMTLLRTDTTRSQSATVNPTTLCRARQHTPHSTPHSAGFKGSAVVSSTSLPDNPRPAPSPPVKPDHPFCIHRRVDCASSGITASARLTAVEMPAVVQIEYPEETWNNNRLCDERPDRRGRRALFIIVGIGPIHPWLNNRLTPSPPDYLTHLPMQLVHNHQCYTYHTAHDAVPIQEDRLSQSFAGLILANAISTGGQLDDLGEPTPGPPPRRGRGARACILDC